MPSDLRNLVESALRTSPGGWSLAGIGEARSGVRGISARAVLVRSDGFRVDAFVKANREDEPCFLRELAAARLLDGIEAEPWIAPRLLLADEGSRLIAWNFLDAVPLADALGGHDPQQAESALSSLVGALVALHARTAPLARRADAVLLDRAREEATSLRGGVQSVAALLRALDVAPPSDLADTIEIVAASHEADGPLVAFTHGDQAPSNVLLRAGGEAVLVDLEYAAFRPILYDLATWTTVCPLPETTVAWMLERYCAALSRTVPEASTPAFERGWGLACAFRALSMATWFGDGLARENGPWGDAYDRRSALVTACGRAADATRGLKGLESLHDLLSGFERAARRAWDVQSLRWPALG